jgi:hypothetical protein
MSTWGIVLIVAWLLFMVFIWKRMGLGKGRSYGNRLAKYLGWNKNFFHTVLETGFGNTSLTFLNSLEQAGLSHHQATVLLSPHLARGLHALESRFGPQAMIEQARPTVESLLSQWQATQNDSSSA